MSDSSIKEIVREKYAEAALKAGSGGSCGCGTSCCSTEGTAKKVFRQASTTPCPLNRATPSQAPSNKPSAQASKQALALTHSERPTMASKVGSSDKTNWKAVVKLSANVFMNGLS